MTLVAAECDLSFKMVADGESAFKATGDFWLQFHKWPMGQVGRVVACVPCSRCGYPVKYAQTIFVETICVCVFASAQILIHL